MRDFLVFDDMSAGRRLDIFTFRKFDIILQAKFRYDINSFSLLNPFKSISQAKPISYSEGIYRKFRRNLYRCQLSLRTIGIYIVPL